MAFRNGPMFNDDFGYQGGRYDNNYPSREVTVQRVVNIVNNRNHGRPQGFNYRNDDQWCHNGPQRYRNSPDCHWEDDFQDFRGFHGDQRDGSYLEPQYSHDDLRHHLSSRGGRPGPYFRKRGGFEGNYSRDEVENFRGSSGKVMKVRPREKKKPYQETGPEVQESLPKKMPPKPASTPAPESAAATPPVSKEKKSIPAASSTSKDPPPDPAPKPSSPPKDPAGAPGHASSRDVMESEPKHTPSSTVVASLSFRGTVDELLSKEPAEEGKKEVSSAAPKKEGEPEPTPGDDFKVRRAEAIRTKALEIEKVYRQDCETFCSVVKLLVDKEPSLESLLQEPLDKNLLEIKQLCLEELRQFVKELDEKPGSAEPRP